MSTATFQPTRPIEPAPAGQRRGGNRTATVLIKQRPLTPGEQIVDWIEALPVVCAALRAERGLIRRQAAAEMTITEVTLRRFEKGRNVQTDSLMAIAEWVGEVSPEEWERLRHTNIDNNMPADELIKEVTMMLRDDHPPNICRRLDIKPDALKARLRRAGRKDLANRFDQNAHRWMWAEDTVLTA